MIPHHLKCRAPNASATLSTAECAATAPKPVAGPAPPLPTLLLSASAHAQTYNTFVHRHCHMHTDARQQPVQQRACHRTRRPPGSSIRRTPVRGGRESVRNDSTSHDTRARCPRARPRGAKLTHPSRHLLSCGKHNDEYSIEGDPPVVAHPPKTTLYTILDRRCTPSDPRNARDCCSCSTGRSCAEDLPQQCRTPPGRRGARRVRLGDRSGHRAGLSGPQLPISPPSYSLVSPASGENEPALPRGRGLCFTVFYFSSTFES